MRSDESAMAGIIETKIRPPQVLRSRLTRTELLPKLTRAAQETGLVSIVAPAGSGKSTVLVDLYKALQLQGYRCFWLSLESADDNPSVFARYLTAALYPLDVSIAEKAMAFLKSQASDNLNGFFDALIRIIAAKNSNFALFVDDFQVLRHPDILRFWNRLIAYAPQGMCTVLASRTPLPLDLSRKRVSGSLFELDQRDLNLTPEQITHFMRDLYSINLPTATAQLLHDTTEGWMVGLQLAGMAIKSSKGKLCDIVNGFSARDRDLKDYLFEAVYKLQDDEIKDFLLQTSPLSKMSAGLCNAVTGNDDGDRMIDRIEAANLFLIPLDRERNWYRYHHLFSEFLRNALSLEARFAKKNICNRAADWCIQQGHLTEAIQYCLDGSNYDKAADLIAEHAEVVAVDRGDHAMIFDWMRRLPGEYHYQRPEILLHHAWSRAFTRDSTTTAISLCEEAETLLMETDQPRWSLSKTERDSYIALSKVIRTIALACAEQASACAESSDRLLNELSGGDPILIASTLGAKGYSNYLLKNLAITARAATDTYAYGKQAGSTYAIVWADALATVTSIELGHIAAADDYASRALRNAGPASPDNSQTAAIAALMKAEVAVQRCDFEIAQGQLAQGRVLASISNPPEFLLLALRNEARLMAWQASSEAARSSLQQGQETALRTNQPRLYYALAAEEIDLLLRCGDFHSAKDTVRRTGILSLDNPQINSDNRSSIVEYIRLTDARMLLAESRSAEAAQQLSLIYRSAQHSDRRSLLQQARALNSIALWKAGKQKDAMWELDKTISVAAPENHAYPLFNAGHELIEILASIQSKRAIGVMDDTQRGKHKFENRLALLLSGKTVREDSNYPVLKPQSNPSDLDEPLTSRELEILRLIAAGLGNQQLADEMLISLSTAKWHVHNIFEKLGVRTRTAAAAYARKRNLI